MARTLSANLYAALEREEHQPALALESQDFTGSIPFDGNAFDFNNDNSWRPYMVYHSSGRLCCITRNKTTADYATDTVRFVYTDPDRTIWKVDVPGLSSGVEINIDYLAITERPDGNLGVIMARYGYLDTTGTLYRAAITAEGVLVESPTVITTYPRATNGSYGCTGLCVTRLSNGTYYCVYTYTTASGWAMYKLTSTNWTSWTGPTQISPTGWTTGTDEEVYSPYVFETAEGDIFLLASYSDYVEDAENKVLNIYSMISTDWGSTWGTPSARTAYTDLGSSAFSPVVVQKSTGQVDLVFYERNNVLRMDANTLGWQDSDYGGESGCPEGFTVRTFYYNPSTGHITCSYGHTTDWSGNRCICGVLVIDMETWTIIDNFGEYSSPQMNKLFAVASSWEDRAEVAQGSKLAAFTAPSSSYSCLMVLDVEDRTFTYYVFALDGEEPYASYGLYRNITIYPTWWPDRTHAVQPTIQALCFNEPNGDRVYLTWVQDYFEKAYYTGYIDLTASPDAGGEYSVNWCGGEHGTYWDRFEIYNICYMSAHDNEGYVIVSAGSYGSFMGGITVHSMATGAILWEWRTTADADFPYRGPGWSRPRYFDGHIYFNILYYDYVGYTNMRGMCDINLATEGIQYHRPTWASFDNYALYGYYAVDSVNRQLWIATKSLISGTEYVTAARYDIDSGAWVWFTYITFPGIPPAYTASAGYNIFYDETTGNVGVGLGQLYGYANYQGCIMFNASGSFTQLKYLLAEKTASWEWEEHDDIKLLAQSTTSMNPAAAVDTDDLMWVLWDDFDFITQLYTPYWDRDMGAFDLVDYLTGAVKLRWEVKKPNSLDFTLSRGHLFDPQNSYSTLRDLVKKGRLMTVRMGEIYEGAAYLENQGTFVVVETSLQYGMAQYPTIRVRAESLSTIWKEQNVIATTLYTSTPDTAIANVLQNYAGLGVADYDIPEFVNEHDIEHQFLDLEVWDIIEELCDHWFYVPYDDMDGIFTCLRVNLEKAVDHIYSSGAKISGFTPDDSYSDFTNAVRVMGETDDYLDVLYDEELITALAGTVGWWEKKTEHTVRYSQDDSRQCRDPRLYVVQSIQLQGLLMDMLSSGDGGEYISYEDPEERYCVVTIEVPDLTAAVVGAIVAMVAIGAASIGCDGYFTGWCGVMIAALAVAASLVMYLLSAVANYQYEVYARPLGEEKQSIEYTANDYEHQQSLDGRVIRQDIDDSLCYSVSECRRVAEGNLAIVQAQRKRIKFKKVAHMQDEILDKVTIPHPYSGEDVVVVVTGITRTYKKGGGTQGGMWDEIEGWRTLT